MSNRRWKIVVVLLALAATGVLSDGAGTRAGAPAVPLQPTTDVADLTQCLAERNGGACVKCCHEAIPEAPGNLCSHFCNSPHPPPPPPEPQP